MEAEPSENVAPRFDELLQTLRIGRHKEALAAHHIASVADLSMLSKADCKELGFSIGERNRLAAWAAPPGDAMALDNALHGLAVTVDALEKEVLELQEEEEEFKHVWGDQRQRDATAARQKAGARGQPMRMRTRIGPSKVQAQSKQAVKKRRRTRTKAKPKPAVAVLSNALFANAGSARRIGFSIDISGSMGAGTPMGAANRLDVVKQHLLGAIASMDGAFNAAFNIVAFDQECHLLTGPALLEATWTGRKKAEAAVAEMQPGGGNGGEAACLRALLKMNPQAIFFLGDGGWSESELIAAAQEAKQQGVVVHSIAFFTSGGGEWASTHLPLPVALAHILHAESRSPSPLPSSLAVRRTS